MCQNHSTVLKKPYNFWLNLLLDSNIKQNMDDYETAEVKINFNQKLDGHVGYSSSPFFFH